MKTITIDFTKDNLGTIAREGEHNRTQLVFTLDEDLQMCDFINVKFGTNENLEDDECPVLEYLHPDEGGTTLTIKLNQDMTVRGLLYMQLDGYVIDSETSEPHMIAKSPVVNGVITPSLKGVKKTLEGNPSLLDIIISKIHKLMELAHFHRNKEILDAITEDSLKPESSPEIPLVYELPENPKAGDVCRLIRSEITAADGGRTVFFDYANLENLVKAGETHYGRVHYTININADEYSTWLRISVDYSHHEIEITVEKFNSLYESFEGDFDQWCAIFCLNDNGEWEFSTEENNVGYNSSYHYNRQTDTITYLLEPLASVNIPNEYISSVTVDKDIDINIFDINIFHLEPIIMLYDGEWRAVANESLLYKQNGATISKHETLEKTDGSKFFRLYLDWGKEVAPLTAKRWIDIPIEGTKESTEPGIIGTQSTGIQLQLGGTGNGKTIPIVTALPETAKEGDIVLYKPKGNTFTINDAGKTVYMEYSWIESYNGNGESFASQSMAECDSYGAAETGFYIEHLRGNPLYINYSAKDLVHNTLYGSLVWQYNAEENKYVFDSENSYGVDENGDTVYFTEPPQKFTLFYNFITEPTTTTVWDNVKLCPFTFFYIKPVLMHYQSGAWKELHHIPKKTSELENDSGFITADDIPESDSSADLSEIAETVTVNERVTLFDSDTDDLIVGLVTATGYNSLHTSYMTLDFIDVSGISTVTFKVNAYTPADASNPGRDFYKAFLDADLKTIEGTREPCQMYGVKDSDGKNLTGHTTSGLHHLNSGDADYAYGLTATLDVPEAAKYLALTNLKAGDTIDIEVYSEVSGEVVRIKKGAMPVEFKELQEKADTTAEQAEQNTKDIAELKASAVTSISLSNYVEEHIENVAISAKAHMKADSLCIVLYTDTHYTANDTCYQTEIAKRLAEATNASAILHLGDLAHMHTEGKEIGVKVWHKHSRFLQGTKIPYLQVVGNHDDGNIYLHSVTNDYLAENYLTAYDLYFATTKQSRNHITMGSVSGGYYYFDDEDSKTRIIVLNSHEYPWEVNDEGVLMYDSNAADYRAEIADPENATPPYGISSVYSPEQLLWLANVALDFSDKENESEWGVIVNAHALTNWANVNVLFQDFKTGTKCTRFGSYPSPNNIYDYSTLQANLTNDFSTVGARKVAFLLGDVHCDAFNTDNNYPVMYFLNASPAKDGDIAPTKTKGTPTETAISVLVVTPSENKITELRFGAGTNEAGTYNPLTDYDNYRVVEY